MTEDWRQHAACSGASLDLFFPNKVEGGRWGLSYRAARALCRACTVTEPCLADALEDETVRRADNNSARSGRGGAGGGFRAGLTAAERAGMRSKRQKQTA